MPVSVADVLYQKTFRHILWIFFLLCNASIKNITLEMDCWDNYREFLTEIASSLIAIKVKLESGTNKQAEHLIELFRPYHIFEWKIRWYRLAVMYLDSRRQYRKTTIFARELGSFLNTKWINFRRTPSSKKWKLLVLFLFRCVVEIIIIIIICMAHGALCKLNRIYQNSTMQKYKL